MDNSFDSGAAPIYPPVPAAEWRFPKGSLVSAFALALCGGASMVLWTMFEGMWHGASVPVSQDGRLHGEDLFWYCGTALLLGAGCFFAEVGVRAWRVPPTRGSGVIRGAGIASWVLAAASAGDIKHDTEKIR